jgi:hypothetical protein
MRIREGFVHGSMPNSIEALTMAIWMFPEHTAKWVRICSGEMAQNWTSAVLREDRTYSTFKKG